MSDPSEDRVLDRFVRLTGERLGASGYVKAVLDPSGDVRHHQRRAAAAHPARLDGLHKGRESDFVHLELAGRLGSSTGREVELLLDASCGSVICARPSAYPSALADSLNAFRSNLVEHGVQPDFVGTHRSGSGEPTLLAVSSRLTTEGHEPPAHFRVIALITAFNEEDVISQVISHLADQGVDVILTDNWSTDATVERASEWLGRGLLRIEQFPPTGRSDSFDLAAVLQHESELALSEPADWFIHHDADEIRQSPWPAKSLRQAFYVAELNGFNAVDHTQLDFHPVDDRFAPGEPLETQFHYFSPAGVVARDYRVNAWRNTGQAVDLARSGGHAVEFASRRVFPYNFLLKHYPIRSQTHGEQKVLRDRKPRWNQEERKRGWHFQYDHIRKGHSFLHNPSSLTLFDESFPEDMLIERLSGIGMHVDPARYSWRTRRFAITWLRRLGLLNGALTAQRRARALFRRDVSLGKR